MGRDAKGLALLRPSWPWETGGGCLGGGGPETLPLWGWIKAALGAGLLLWEGRRGRRTQLWPRHFKNLLLFHLNSPPPPHPRLCLPEWHFRFGIKAPGSVPHCAARGVAGGGQECPLPGLPWGSGGGAPTGQALAGVYGGADPPGPLPSDTAPRTAYRLALGQGLYDHVLIPCPQ